MRFGLAPLLVAALLAQELPLFRSEVQFIAVDVQVLSQDKPVTGLGKRDFLVWDEGRSQEISSLSHDEQPLDVMLLLDISASTVPLEMQIKRAATEAFAYLQSGDRAGVIVFHDRPLLAHALSWDWLKVLERIRTLPWGLPGTELHSTVLMTAMHLKKYGRKEARRAIVMLTDNEGTGSSTEQDVRNTLWESDVVLNAVLYPGGSRMTADVRKFATATGGDTLRIKGSHVPLGEMFARLRQRYMLLYRAPQAEAGSVRRIRVDLKQDVKRQYPKLVIRARTGYRAGEAGSEIQSPMGKGR